MTQDVLRYDRMVEGALRGVVREALEVTAEHGLPGSHHFYLTFRTGAPGVEMSEDLRRQYPREMTIVLQHQFWDLDVTADAFSVTLSFSNQPQTLHIPFAALTAFVDPSVKFGLQFNVGALGRESAAAGEDGTGAAGPEPEVQGEAAEEGMPAGPAANVVTLDAFRKK
ncbi:MAG: SspB family protein [Alphaproteobacteria bacterium]